MLPGTMAVGVVFFAGNRSLLLAYLHLKQLQLQALDLLSSFLSGVYGLVIYERNSHITRHHHEAFQRLHKTPARWITMIVISWGVATWFFASVSTDFSPLLFLVYFSLSLSLSLFFFFFFFCACGWKASTVLCVDILFFVQG
uniref:Uncharacterized protein n=1 Tax=Trypanosoma vivax (strain Y486) TaxID=1055687 RepID=G0UAX4_TRYVY|nr:hypothetical protein TVY486_1104450 [Trypanosoma vivax Y486]